jgi:hypothetical protein
MKIWVLTVQISSILESIPKLKKKCFLPIQEALVKKIPRLGNKVSRKNGRGLAKSAIVLVASKK